LGVQPVANLNETPGTEIPADEHEVTQDNRVTNVSPQFVSPTDGGNTGSLMSIISAAPVIKILAVGLLFIVGLVFLFC
jgi:hypothetical protein